MVAQHCAVPVLSLPTPNERDGTGRVFAAFVTIAVVALFIGIAAFAVRLAPLAGLRFSTSTEEWSRFGEYPGGPRGLLYGLFAFLGVLMTVYAAQAD